MLTTSAVDLWTKATVAAADVVNAINTPEEEDGRFPRAEELRFPRPPGTEYTGGSGGAGGATSGSKYVGMGSNTQNGGANNSTSRLSNSSPHRSTKSNESWDDLDDLLQSNNNNSNNSNGTYSNSSGGIAFNDEVSSNTSRVAALKLDNPSKAKPVPASNSRSSLSSNHNSTDNLADHASPASTSGSPNKGLNNSGSTPRLNASIGSGGHVKPPVAAASPVGDDFFNSFGI